MPVEVEARMAEILDTDLSNLEVDYFGLNHYGWFTKVQCNGEDATEKLKKHVAEYGYVSKASYEDAWSKIQTGYIHLRMQRRSSTIFQIICQIHTGSIIFLEMTL